MWVGHFKSDHGDAGCRDFVRDDGRDFLFRLEFDDQIHALPDELVSILKGDLGVIFIVEDEQVYSCRRTGSFQARKVRRSSRS